MISVSFPCHSESWDNFTVCHNIGRQRGNVAQALLCIFPGLTKPDKTCLGKAKRVTYLMETVIDNWSVNTLNICFLFLVPCVEHNSVWWII